MEMDERGKLCSFSILSLLILLTHLGGHAGIYKREYKDREIYRKHHRSSSGGRKENNPSYKNPVISSKIPNAFKNKHSNDKSYFLDREGGALMANSGMRAKKSVSPIRKGSNQII